MHRIRRSSRTTSVESAKVMASTNPSSRRRLLAGGIALALIAAGGAVLASRVLAPTAQPERPIIVLGDGLNTPADMAWVPGGVFLMGSDSTLAKADERP